MMNESPIIETSSTLGIDASFTSATESIHGSGDRVENIVGTVYSDQDGTLKVQFDDGSGNWDGEATRSYTATDKMTFNVTVYAPYVRIVYVNGATAQSTFRLRAWEMK